MTKDINYYMSLPYDEVIQADPAGGYVGFIPMLRGCITQGETKKEVLDMLDDAKRCWLETAMENGFDIPETNAENYSGRFNLRIPKSLHMRLAMAAEAEGVSLNQMAMYLISNGLKA